MGQDWRSPRAAKPFTFHNWEGAVSQHGEPDGVRYRMLTWLNDRKRLVAAASDGVSDREVLTILTADGSGPPRALSDLDVGRVVELEVAPRSIVLPSPIIATSCCWST